jgi:hypothetical protein
MVVLEWLWVVLAAVGLVVWNLNLSSAIKSLNGIKAVAGAANGRLIYGRFAVSETALFVFMEIILVTIGVSALVLEVVDASLLVVIGAFVVSSCMVGLGFQWRSVDRAVMKGAVERRRMADRPEKHIE